MLPSMPLLFSISRDSLLEGGDTVQPEQPPPELQVGYLEQVHIILQPEPVLKQENPVASTEKEALSKPVPILPKLDPLSSDPVIPIIAFDSLPDEKKECDDELVLLAENSPFGEKRRLLAQSAQTNTSRKKRKGDTCDEKNSCEEQANHFATAYFMKLKGELDETTFQKFIALLSEINEKETDVCKLYSEICDLLEGHSELAEEFIGFLSPQQALEVGKLSEYLEFKKTWNFFRKLDGFHFNKLYHLLEQLSTNPGTASGNIRNSLQSSFKGHPNITEGILGLLPEGKPICSKEDFDDISDLTAEQNKWETLCIQDSPSNGCVGSDCECICHSCVPKKFCTFCNIKFSKGQIFVQTGKGLRFAKVAFRGCQQEEVLQRLNPVYYNKQTMCKILKTNNPTQKESKSSSEQRPKIEVLLPDAAKEDANDCAKENQYETVHLDEDEEILYLEKQLNADNLNFDEKFVVCEDTVLESTNSEEPEDIESDSGDEFNLEASPNSLKHDEDSFNSSEQILEVKNEKDDNGKTSNNANETPIQTQTKMEDKDVENNSIDLPQSSVGIEESTEEKDIGSEKEPEVEQKLETKPTRVWTREEDKLILQAFQRQLGTEQTFSEISEQLPSRTVDDIQGRFQVLMNLLEKMTSGCYDGYL